MNVPATTSSRTNKKGSGGGPAQPSGAAVRPTAPAQFSALAMPFQSTAANQQAVMFSIHSEKKVVLLENVHNAFNAAHLPSITFTISGQISPITDFNTLATNSLPQRLGGGAANEGSYGDATERAIEAINLYLAESARGDPDGADHEYEPSDVTAQASMCPTVAPRE